MRIEFYVLRSAAPEDRLLLACQLTHKAWRSGMPVFVRAPDAATATQLDALLWSFRADSFVPHHLYQEQSAAPVVVGENQLPQYSGGLLLNLGDSRYPALEAFVRVIEIVTQEPSVLAASREHFRLYRQRGFSPERVEC